MVDFCFFFASDLKTFLLTSVGLFAFCDAEEDKKFWENLLNRLWWDFPGTLKVPPGWFQCWLKSSSKVYHFLLSFQVNDDEILEDKCELELWGFVTFSGVKPTLPIIHSQNIIFQSPNKYMPIIIDSLSALKIYLPTWGQLF